MGKRTSPLQERLEGKEEGNGVQKRLWGVRKEEKLKSGWGAGYSYPTHRQSETGNPSPQPPLKSWNDFAEGRRGGLKKDFGQDGLHSKSHRVSLSALVPSIAFHLHHCCLPPPSSVPRRLWLPLAEVKPSIPPRRGAVPGCLRPHAAFVIASAVLPSSCPTPVILVC